MPPSRSSRTVRLVTLTAAVGLLSACGASSEVQEKVAAHRAAEENNVATGPAAPGEHRRR